MSYYPLTVFTTHTILFGALATKGANNTYYLRRLCLHIEELTKSR